MGVGPGCYIVLPVLGPSTARDTFGSTLNYFGGDPWYNVTIKNDTQYFKIQIITIQKEVQVSTLELKIMIQLKI